MGIFLPRSRKNWLSGCYGSNFLLKHSDISTFICTWWMKLIAGRYGKQALN